MTLRSTVRIMPVALALGLLVLAGCGVEDDAKEAVRRGTMFPEATKFVGVMRCRGDRSMVMGFFDEKTALGGYAGTKPFVYADGAVSYIGDADFVRLTDRCFPDRGPTRPPA